MTALQSPNSFQERVEIVGEGTNVVIDNASRLVHYRRAATPPEDSFVGEDEEAPLVWEPAFSLSQVRNKVLFIGGFAGEVKHFAEAVLNDTPPTSDIVDGLEAVRLVHALCEGPGKVVRVSDVA
jgi:predicted dehydrogenase